MMKLATVEMLSGSGDGASRFFSEATFQEDADAETLCYRVEGDEGKLTLSDRCLLMTRSGACNLNARFCERGASEFYISSDGQKGSLPLKTRLYRYVRSCGKREAELCYELGDSNNIQTFHISILIKIPEEK